MADAAKIIELRELLKERFPSAHSGRAPEPETWLTGIPALDEAGIPMGSLTELVNPTRSGGSALLLRGLLEKQVAAGHLPALIDGRDSFEPQSLAPDVCNRLLWIRCRDTRESLQAADILLRDGNLAFVVLDLQFNPAPEFRRIPATTWHRLQSLVARTGAVCLIMTPTRLVGSARLRLTLNSLLQIASLERPAEKLRAELRFDITRRRRAGRIEEPAALHQIAG
jgi:hypothetical protein